MRHISKLLFASALLVPSTSQAYDLADLGVVSTSTAVDDASEDIAYSARARGGALAFDASMSCLADDDTLRCDLSLDLWTDADAWQMDARIKVELFSEHMEYRVVSRAGDWGAFASTVENEELLDALLDRQLSIIIEDVWGDAI